MLSAATPNPRHTKPCKHQYAQDPSGAGQKRVQLCFPLGTHPLGDADAWANLIEPHTHYAGYRFSREHIWIFAASTAESASISTHCSPSAGTRLNYTTSLARGVMLSCSGLRLEASTAPFARSIFGSILGIAWFAMCIPLGAVFVHPTRFVALSSSQHCGSFLQLPLAAAAAVATSCNNIKQGGQIKTTKDMSKTGNGTWLQCGRPALRKRLDTDPWTSIVQHGQGSGHAWCFGQKHLTKRESLAH